VHWERIWRRTKERDGTNDGVDLIDWGECAGVDETKRSVFHPGSVPCCSGGEALCLGDVKEHLHRVGASRGDLDKTVAEARGGDKDPIGDRDRASFSKGDQRDHRSRSKAREE
jgi:hypothetical protein